MLQNWKEFTVDKVCQMKHYDTEGIICIGKWPYKVVIFGEIKVNYKLGSFKWNKNPDICYIIFENATIDSAAIMCFKKRSEI